MVLDGRGLNDSAVSLDDRVSVDVKFASIAMALDIALKPLDLTWEVAGNTIIITSPERRDETEEVRFHNVADLPEILPIPLGRGSPAKRPFVYYDVRTFVEPDTWPDGTGPAPVFLTPDKSCVFFSHVPCVHDEAAALFDAIRQTKNGTNDAIKVVTPPYERYDTLVDRALSGIVSVDFQNVPLRDAIRDLRNRAGIEIQLDMRGLADNQVSTAAPVTLHVSAPLREVLELLLNAFSLTSMVNRGVVWVTSREEADETFSIVIYPVEDLLIPGADEYKAATEIVRIATNHRDNIALATVYGAIICAAPQPSQQKIAAAFERFRTERKRRP